VAVVVKTLAPVARVTDPTFQDGAVGGVAPPQVGVQVAVPLGGVHVGQPQVTLMTPTSSLAVPASVVKEALDTVQLFPTPAPQSVVMVTVGGLDVAAW